MFFQGILTQDVVNLQNPVYACMLTPQGRFFCDFFIIPSADGWLIEIDPDRAEEILKKLSLYRLRSDVSWENLNLNVGSSLVAFDQSYLDPRHKDMGYRFHTKDPWIDPNYINRRFSLGLAEAELIPGKSIILEYKLDNFNAISWEKGCYIGQELMARTHYLGTLRKHIFSFECKNSFPSPEESIVTKDQKTAGKLLSFSNKKGLAMIYVECAKEDLFLACGTPIFLKKTVLK